jgi:predicted metal-dependent peptidase
MSQKIRHSVIALLLGRTGNKAVGAFFSAVAMKLKVVENSKVDTMSTNGKVIYYNQKFLDSMSQDETTGVLAHEILHVANLHMCRRGTRDQKVWNMACDLAINPIVLESGLRLPTGGLMPGVSPFADFPVGESAEKYYELLMKMGSTKSDKEKEKGDGGSGGKGQDDKPAQPQKSPETKEGSDEGQQDKAKSEGEGSGIKPSPSQSQDTSGIGGVMDAEPEAEGDIRATVEMAKEMCKSRGNMPSGLRNMFDSGRTVIDWRTALQNLLTQKAKSDYIYSRPSRRASGGVILPVQDGYKCPKCAVLVDTSGSISDKVIGQFVAEIEAFRKEAKCETTLIMHHTDAYSVTEVAIDDDLVMPRIQSGGTSHVDAIAKAVESEAQFIVSLTDCESVYPQHPGMDVIWCRYNQSSRPASPPEYGSLVDIVD